MANFQFKARNTSGKLIQGTITADSQKEAMGKIELSGSIPLELAEVRQSDVVKSIKAVTQRKVKFAELNMFTRQLHVLQKAGLPLLSSLNALKAQTTSEALKKALDQAIRDIEGGSNLSLALAAHPHIFNPLYVNMVKTGEASGRLDEVLERVAILGEHEEKIQLRIKAAMRYPLMVVGAIVIGFCVLITLVVPRFAKLYSKFDTALPFATRILIAINHIVSHYWWMILLAGILIAFLLRKYFSTSKGIWIWDKFRITIYVFGPLMLKIVLSRFCRITSTLLKSGLPILQILDLVKNSMGNAVIADAIEKIKASVNQGKGMFQPMQASGLFPPVVLQMVAVGEDTGKMDELLMHVAEYYDMQIDHTIDNLVSLIEPLLILVLGIGVLFMALGIFMPMWNMVNLFKA